MVSFSGTVDPATPVNLVADGDLDHVPEQAFYNCGGIDDVMKAYERIKKDIG